MAETAQRRSMSWPDADWLAPQPPLSRHVIRGDATVRDKAGAAFGVALPQEPCRAHSSGGRAALWLGPDEWLLLAPAPDAFHIEAALNAALQLQPHSLVDVGHRQVACTVHGQRAEWLLESHCPLPLNLRDFPVGMCTRTVFARSAVVLWRTDEHAFHVEVGRSFVAYVVALLQEVAREAGDDGA
jgi:sarcosine oxidase subunit gamma